MTKTLIDSELKNTKKSSFKEIKIPGQALLLYVKLSRSSKAEYSIHFFGLIERCKLRGIKLE